MVIAFLRSSFHFSGRLCMLHRSVRDACSGDRLFRDSDILGYQVGVLR